MIDLEANTKQISRLLYECSYHLGRKKLEGTTEELVEYFRTVHNCTMVPYNWHHKYEIYWNYLLIFEHDSQEKYVQTHISMIILDRNNFLHLLDKLGYYEDDKHDTVTDFLKKEHYINYFFSLHHKEYRLTFLTEHKETIFKLKYSDYIYDD